MIINNFLTNMQKCYVVNKAYPERANGVFLLNIEHPVFIDLPRPVLVGSALLAGSAVMAIGFTALYAQFMDWADPAQGGVDFTVFQCLDATISMALGVLVGLGAEYRGYDTVFGIAAAAALAMALILPTARNRPARPAA